MKKTLLTLGFVTLLSGNVQAFELNEEPRTVATNGVCFSKVANNRVKINIKVSTTDKESAVIAFNKTKASNADLEDYIKNLHIPGIDLETGSISITEEKQWSSVNKKQELLGYKAEILTTVDIPMTQKEYMGILITKAASYSGVYIENFAVYSSQPVVESAKNECLTKAVKDAKRKASKIAIAGGAIVDKMLTASYYRVQAPKPYTLDNRAVMTMAKSESTGSAPISINSKEDTIKVEVSTVWKIK